MLVTTQWPLKRAATSPHLSGFVFYGCLESLTELSALCIDADYIIYPSVTGPSTDQAMACRRPGDKQFLNQWCLVTTLVFEAQFSDIWLKIRSILWRIYTHEYVVWNLFSVKMCRIKDLWMTSLNRCVAKLSFAALSRGTSINNSHPWTFPIITHSLKLILPPSCAILMTSLRPPTWRLPWMTIAMIPDIMTHSCMVSVQMTAFIPPCER